MTKYQIRKVTELIRLGFPLMEVCRKMKLSYTEVSNVFYDFIGMKKTNGSNIHPKEPDALHKDRGVHFGHPDRHHDSEDEYGTEWIPVQLGELSMSEVSILYSQINYENEQVQNQR